ncbi:Programmed cell death protein 5 [Tritrichomonas musculus]|uniref:Programmed cell death protein 5 n=1 Tax=Tritrichomonas musculus TaxID=1915356 RepID=A0ABR2IXS9_9EUKA
MQNKQEDQKEKEAQKEAQRQQILDSLLGTEAKERLGRVRLVKPEKARRVEDAIIMMAQQQRLSGTIPDEQVKQMLESLSDKATEVKIAHRGKEDTWDDDDEGW